MESLAEIMRIVFPLIIVGAISIFVILRLQNKHKKNQLGKKKTQGAQFLLDSLIPWGTFLGIFIGGIISFLFPMSMLNTVSIGGGIGMLVGYFAYEIYSRTEGSSSS
ncbi:hypothetical protein H9635_06825 [Solibacillus sp. A46]|uniref:Group-specific protein n=1 Tax=Solibacillus faecavium TaxID=2762221 RepID=A0ABR8XWX7_9BACL|nr:hypothetical protein [Solibacillus faecavium]MBD8036452.1 hypothetical protein [Solibacillus faecavium]